MSLNGQRGRLRVKVVLDDADFLLGIVTSDEAFELLHVQFVRIPHEGEAILVQPENDLVGGRAATVQTINNVSIAKKVLDDTHPTKRPSWGSR